MAASITSKKTCARQADEAKWIDMKKIESAETTTAIVPVDIRPLICEIRGQQVILDRDLAMLYGVPTKALNQAVKRNAERFPDRFMFRLSESEMDELVTNCDRFGQLKHSSVTMCAFTEQGIVMLSSVLRSAIAVRVSIRIMDAFVAMRKALASMAPMQSRLEAIERRQISDQSRNEERFDQMVRCVPQRRRSPDLRRRKAGRGDDPRPACFYSKGDIRDEQLQERRSCEMNSLTFRQNRDLV